MTDLIFQASRSGKKIDVLQWGTPSDLMGVNNPWERSRAAEILNQRKLYRVSLEGVHLQDRQSIWIDEEVKLDAGVVIEPNVILKGNVKIGAGTIIRSQSRLENTQVGSDCEIKTGTICIDSQVGDRVRLGPYAHLRPDSQIQDDAKIGNFVEIKKSTIGKKTSIAHLSYVGDALIGERVNIGCGFVTCNFDGRVINGQRKHQTVIGDGAFIGSDCQTVAPVRIEKEAYVASGSTVTQDVASGDLAIARSRQVNKKGFARRLMGMSSSSTPGSQVKESKAQNDQSEDREDQDQGEGTSQMTSKSSTESVKGNLCAE